MKHLLILTALFLSACNGPIQKIDDKTSQEIVTEIQESGGFTYGILAFSCEQLFVAE